MLYFEYIVHASGEELRAKAPPEAKPWGLYEWTTSVERKKKKTRWLKDTDTTRDGQLKSITAKNGWFGRHNISLSTQPEKGERKWKTLVPSKILLGENSITQRGWQTFVRQELGWWTDSTKGSEKGVRNTINICDNNYPSIKRNDRSKSL